MQRFTINELNSMSNKKFAALILSEELGKRGNTYTPIANKIRSAISELENDGRSASALNGKTVTVTAVERDGLDLRMLTIIFEIPDKDFDILEGIKLAVQDYIKTPEGKKTMEYNSGYFNLADVAGSLPNKYCVAHGFSMVDSALSDINIDWDYDFAICRSVEPGKYTELQIKELWSQFEDIPVDPVTELIEVPFLHFGPGTHSEEIWKWFDEVYPNGVNGLVCGE